MRRAMGVLAELTALVGCEPEYACGALVYSETEGHCVCPEGTVLAGDGGMCVALGGDGGVDAGECVPSGAEVCNGADDDCDGTTDENAASSCARGDRATAMACVDGACAVASCEPGFDDCDEGASNGCEAELGTLAACGSCGETCGWSCTENGCDDAVQIDGGRDHLCVVRQSGSVYCWGANDRGQLGIGTTSVLETEPRRVRDASGTGYLTNIVRVSAGDAFTCAVERSGAVWCWGTNPNGQLGNGSTTPSPLPVAVLGLAGVREVTAGGGHACALTDGAEVWCWGRNSSGEVGAIGRNAITSPMRVTSLANVASVQAAARHTCVLRTDGAVRCFGTNENAGELGDGGGATSSYNPVAPVGLRPSIALGVGDRHTCVVTEAPHELWCWGSSYSGDFHPTEYTAFTTPVRIDVSGTPRRVDAGWGGTCVTFDTGRVQCFQTSPSSLPTNLAEFALPGQLSDDGPIVGCARLSSGAVLCWDLDGVPAALPAP